MSAIVVCALAMGNGMRGRGERCEKLQIVPFQIPRHTPWIVFVCHSVSVYSSSSLSAFMTCDLQPRQECVKHHHEYDCCHQHNLFRVRG